MHEESETIQRTDGRWINVYGKGKAHSGQLPGTPDYGTVDEAVTAAQLRSKEYGEHMGMSDLMAQTIAKGNITGPTGGQKTGLPQMMQPVLGPGRAELSMGTPHEAAEPQGRYADMPPGKGLGALLDVAKMKMLAAPDFDPLAYINKEQMSGPWAEANARQATVKAATPESDQARPGEFKDVSGQTQEVYQEGKAGTFKDVNGKQQKVYQDAKLTDMSNAITQQHQAGMGMMK